MNARPDRSRKFSRYVIALVVVAISVGGIAVRLHIAGTAKDRLGEAYPRLEQLLAIYSVINWRSPEQLPPIVTEDNYRGGSEFQLSCPNIAWGSGGFDKSDSLFKCFAVRTEHYVPEDGAKVTGPQFKQDEDWSYHFKWDSIFGYEVEIHVQGYEAREKESPIRKQVEACREELRGYANGPASCRFAMYHVAITGLTVAKSVEFITADGRTTWNSDGSVNRRNERLIYLDENTPVTIGELNAVVQKTLRALGFAEKDLSSVAPKVEVLWMGKDDAFLRALVAEFDKAPDLVKLSGFIQGK